MSTKRSFASLCLFLVVILLGARVEAKPPLAALDRPAHEAAQRLRRLRADECGVFEHRRQLIRAQQALRGSPTAESVVLGIDALLDAGNPPSAAPVPTPSIIAQSISATLAAMEPLISARIAAHQSDVDALTLCATGPICPSLEDACAVTPTDERMRALTALPTATPQSAGISWEGDVAAGLAQYLGDRANEELSLWLEDEIIKRLCNTSYPAAGKMLPGASLFPTTCSFTNVGTVSVLGAAFAASLRSDLERVPIYLALMERNVDAASTEQLVGTLDDFRSGRPPLARVALWESVGTLRDACVAGDDFACMLTTIGALTRAAGDVETDRPIDDGSPESEIMIAHALADLVKVCTGTTCVLDAKALKPSDVDFIAVLKSVQRIHTAVREAKQQSVDVRRLAGAQVVTLLSELVDACAKLFVGSARASFLHVWHIVEPALLASTRIMQGKIGEGVRDVFAPAIDPASAVSLPPTLVTTLSLAADLAGAKDATAVDAALKSAAAPLGSWKSKHEHAAIALNAYVGGAFGYERPLTSRNLAPASAGSALGAIGVDFTVPCHHWTVGIFVSALDMGQLLNVPISPMTRTVSPGVKATASADGTVRLAQVLAPGLYLHTSLGNTPITAGFGVDLAPALRTYELVKTSDESTSRSQESMLRANAFIGVDLDILPIVTAH